MKQEYKEAVQLLLDIAPTAFSSGAFAMKGGTAINLFVQDMPRLSVDIDLVYHDGTKPRDEALTDIKLHLENARETLTRRGFHVTPPRSVNDEFKLTVNAGRKLNHREPGSPVEN